MSEVRVMAEGVLRIVPASGSGTAWVTAAASAGLTALIVFIVNTGLAN